MKLAKRMVLFNDVSHGDVEIISNLYMKKACFNEPVYNPGDTICIVTHPNDGYYLGIINPCLVHDKGNVECYVCDTEYSVCHNEQAVKFMMPNDDVVLHVKFSKLI